jgi:hypothetical protein
MIVTQHLKNKYFPNYWIPDKSMSYSFPIHKIILISETFIPNNLKIFIIFYDLNLFMSRLFVVFKDKLNIMSNKH